LDQFERNGREVCGVPICQACGMTIEKRVSKLPWQRVAEELERQGWATTGPLLTRAEREELAASYDDHAQFRSTVTMSRHGFGLGEYRYFAYPLPVLVRRLRDELYERLAPVANRWREALGIGQPFPDRHCDYVKRCQAAGQRRPTPLMLRYGAGDYNCLHQDLYGQLAFPLQAAFLLAEPGADFEGGEFVLTEQRPRMQSRVHVVPLSAGEAVIFAVSQRPVQGARGTYRVTMRHGVSPVRSGRRHTLGIIFHDAA
jgi:uncharacterized protein